MSKTISALFTTKEQAEAIANIIEKKGIARDKISVVYLKDENPDVQPVFAPVQDADPTSGTLTGSAVGGMAGLMLGAGTIAIPGLGIIAAAGPVAGLLGGALAGGAIGGLTDSIGSGGVGRYGEQLRRGMVYMSVPITDDNGGRISKILKEHGAVSLEVHNR